MGCHQSSVTYRLMHVHGTYVQQTASGPPPRHHLRTSENMKKKKSRCRNISPLLSIVSPNTKREAKKITSVGEGGIESFGTPAHRPRCCHARAAQNKQKNVRRGSRPLFPRFQSKRVCRWGVWSRGESEKMAEMRRHALGGASPINTTSAFSFSHDSKEAFFIFMGVL